MKLTKFTTYAKKHKIISAIVVIVILILGYYAYKAVFPTVTTTTYTLTRARRGTISETMTGTGQVASALQLEVKSKAAGTIQSINTKVGAHVTTGELLATIDHSDADIDLQNARITYQKLIQGPKQSELSTANNNLTKAYDTAYNNMSSAFLDLPSVVTGMKDLFYSRDGFISDQNSPNFVSQARTLRDTASHSYDKATDEYNNLLVQYRTLTRNSPTTTVEALLNQTLTTVKDMAVAVSQAQDAVNYIIKVQSDYKPTTASQALTDVTTWSSKMNDLSSSLLSGITGLESSKNSLSDLLAGADALDIQSGQIALTQKEKEYSNYFVRAPFDGTIGKISVNIFDQASNGTVIATLVGENKVVTVALDEVDAAKVSEGQPVVLDFDAIDGFTATGTVSQVDLVGTVSQGVVSYNVKIAINSADQRIKPGMSVNATITTKQVSDVIVVPSTAVKTVGGKSYVQVFDPKYIAGIVGANSATSGLMTLSSNRFAVSGSGMNFGTSTATTTASTTRRTTYSGNSTGLSVTTTDAPTQVFVTTGATDGSSIAILSGLSGGELVVTKSTTSSSNTTTATPSILSGIGGGQRTGSASVRQAGGVAIPR
jgi:HlyD family secretion protein